MDPSFGETEVLETRGEESSSQAGFRIGYMTWPLLWEGPIRSFWDCLFKAAGNSCPKEFLNSFFLLAFLCFVTKNLGRNVDWHSLWATPSLSQPLRKSRTSTHWVKPHFKILRRSEICYTRRVQSLQTPSWILNIMLQNDGIWKLLILHLFCNSTEFNM